MIKKDTTFSRILLAKDVHLTNKNIIKIHGTLRVGSNYLAKLIEKNYAGNVPGSEELNWKHGRVDYTPRMKYLIMVRDPYAWLYSFWQWEVLHNRTQASTVYEFITNSLQHTVLTNEWNSEDVLEIWNLSYRHWLQYSEEKNVCTVKYEDVISDFKSELERIAVELKLNPKQSQLANIDHRADDWKKPKTAKELDVGFYKGREYMKHYDDKTLQLVNSKIDLQLLENFSYSLEESAHIRTR